MQYPELFHLIEAQHLSLLAIEPDDLRRVVEQPAALPDVQVTFEGDLVNRLLLEVQGQVGALPLLQFTLDQLFQQRSGRQLTISAYRELGGVKGALATMAEKTYDALPSEEHRKLARALFLRLIDPGSSERDTTRRRAALSEFSLQEASQTGPLQETINAFITARLLTTNKVAGTNTIEVSHEAVISEWKRLVGWMNEAREDIPLQQAISEDVAEWEQHGKPRDRLYRGSQLKEAQAWAKRNMPSEQEAAFLQVSAHQRFLSLVGVIVLILLLLTSSGMLGFFVIRDNQIASNKAHATATAQVNLLTQLTISAEVARSTAVAVSHVQATAETISQNPYGGTLALDDSLHDNSRGIWDETPSCKFVGGMYHVYQANTNNDITCYANADFSNFTYEVKMSIMKGNCGGLIFRSKSATSSEYFFQVCQDGTYSLVSYPDASYILSPQSNPAIKTGLNQPNIITVVAYHDQFYFYANRQLIGQTQNSEYTDGQIGVSSSSPYTDIAYSDLKVWTW